MNLKFFTVVYISFNTEVFFVAVLTMSSKSDVSGEGADSVSDIEMKRTASSDDEQIRVIKTLHIKDLTALKRFSRLPVTS